MAVGTVAACAFVEGGSVELGVRIGSRLAAVGPDRVGEAAVRQPASDQASSAVPMAGRKTARTASELDGRRVMTSTQEVLGAAVRAGEHALTRKLDLAAAVLAALQVADIGGLG